MGFLIFIFIIIIFSMIINFIEGLNLAKRRCENCKQVVKGVRTRRVYIKRLHVPTLQRVRKKYYWCDKCAKNKNYVIIEETPY